MSAFIWLAGCSEPNALGGACSSTFMASATTARQGSRSRNTSTRWGSTCSPTTAAHTANPGGDACTYGFYEKKDLSRALDKLGGGPILAFGVSLGAGIALQAAAEDARIALVVAVAPISDLRTAATERAPFFASHANIDEAFRIAEREGAFRADDVNPAAAAAKIHAPVLVIHGADDPETPPAHSERVYAALAGPKKLVLVPGAQHNDALTPDAWRQIDDWVAAHWPPGPPT